MVHIPIAVALEDQKLFVKITRSTRAKETTTYQTGQPPCQSRLNLNVVSMYPSETGFKTTHDQARDQVITTGNCDVRLRKMPLLN